MSGYVISLGGPSGSGYSDGVNSCCASGERTAAGGELWNCTANCAGEGVFSLLGGMSKCAAVPGSWKTRWKVGVRGAGDAVLNLDKGAPLISRTSRSSSM